MEEKSGIMHLDLKTKHTRRLPKWTVLENEISRLERANQTIKDEETQFPYYERNSLRIALLQKKVAKLKAEA